MPGSADQYHVARLIFSRLSQAVVIVGAASGNERSCATSTCMYVSFVPPMVAIAGHPASHTTRLIERSREFSLSFLRADQQDVAIGAGRHVPAGDKFAALAIDPLPAPAGALAPAIPGSLAQVWCSLRSAAPHGDHVLFVGEVIAHGIDADGDPLLRFGRRYARLGEPISGEAPEGYVV